jgi:hypothetical protein
MEHFEAELRCRLQIVAHDNPELLKDDHTE